MSVFVCSSDVNVSVIIFAAVMLMSVFVCSSDVNVSVIFLQQ